MKRKTVNGQMNQIQEKIRAARLELLLAEQDENYAEEKFLDTAIERVAIAKANLNSLYRLAKLI